MQAKKHQFQQYANQAKRIKDAAFVAYINHTRITTTSGSLYSTRFSYEFNFSELEIRSKTA